MIKKLLLALTLLSFNLYADAFSDAQKAYDSGDKQKAFQLYTKACDGNNIIGCFVLGLLYDTGDGVRQDKQKAKELFGKACDGGYDSGCKGYRILNEQGY